MGIGNRCTQRRIEVMKIAFVIHYPHQGPEDTIICAEQTSRTTMSLSTIIRIIIREGVTDFVHPNGIKSTEITSVCYFLPISQSRYGSSSFTFRLSMLPVWLCSFSPASSYKWGSYRPFIIHIHLLIYLVQLQYSNGCHLVVFH